MKEPEHTGDDFAQGSEETSPAKILSSKYFKNVESIYLKKHSQLTEENSITTVCSIFTHILFVFCLFLCLCHTTMLGGISSSYNQLIPRMDIIKGTVLNNAVIL